MAKEPKKVTADYLFDNRDRAEKVGWFLWATFHPKISGSLIYIKMKDGKNIKVKSHTKL